MFGRLTALLALAAIASACGSATPTPTKAPVAATPSAVAPSTAPGSTTAPTPGPTAIPSPPPSPSLAAAPAGYQWIYNVTDGYALAAPQKWVFVMNGSDMPTATQIGAIESRFPAMASFVEDKQAGLGYDRVLLFDPVAVESDGYLLGSLHVGPSQPSDDIARTVAARAIVTQLATVNKIKESDITFKLVTLPGAPALEIHYAVTIYEGPSNRAPILLRPVPLRFVQYVLFTSSHTLTLTLIANSERWAAYSPIFVMIASTLRQI